MSDIFDFSTYIKDRHPADYEPGDDLPDAFDFVIEEFKEKPDYEREPVRWGVDKLSEHYVEAQQEVLLSLRDHRYTACQSCHNAGKSFIAARAAARWIDIHVPGEAFVVSTAPTGAQVSAILWRELQRVHTNGALAGQITTSGYPQWKIGKELVAYGRKPAEYSDAAFQGIHARYVLVILDEASGVPRSLFDAVDALATNRNARVLALGNPDNPTSHFATVCKPGSGWNTIRIDGLRTPNMTQDAVEWMECPDCKALGRSEPMLAQLMKEESIPYSTEWVPDSLRDMLLSPIWIEERLHRWVGLPEPGQTVSEASAKSALFTAKVRGIFPTTDSEGVIPLGWVQMAMDRHTLWVEDGSPNDDYLNTHKVVSCDVAREGEDQTCIVIRQKNLIREIRKYRRSDTMETTGNIVAAMEVDEYTPPSLAVVDVIGVGGGVVDRLRELGKPNVAFNAAASGKDYHDRTGEFKFSNVRAAAWWKMRELLDPARGSKIMLPQSETLLADLTAPHWRVMSGGTIQVENKDAIRKRLGRSTDEGDAVVQSFWIDSAYEGSTEVFSWDTPTTPTDAVVSWFTGDEEFDFHGSY